MAERMKDPFGRILNYVRISLTDRCNLRCVYCMPPDGVPWIPHEEIMSYESILFLCSVLQDLGVQKIRFTGGEPFVRKGFVSFLGDVRKNFPSLKIALTTNGTYLDKWAKQLAGLRLESVNISLDTLDPGKFHAVTRGGDLQDVLRGIEGLRETGQVPIKVNMVVMRDYNLEEVPTLTEFAREKGILLRFIEFMPLDSDVWAPPSFVAAEEILSLLPASKSWTPLPADQGTGNVCGPAREYRSERRDQSVGIISAVSDHFCARCNRLRITSRGVVRPCLFSESGISILEDLRKKDREQVSRGILSAAEAKPDRGRTEIPPLDRKENEPGQSCRMSRIGG
ncbi:MAG: GTP 3',8-cyclase MoaA [Synergistaceae bacterium]|nr:GTP 3',8-cyclase MoaA [Synergistaceae bacterium]